MRVLVVVAHSDDESFGCGGTIARISAAGNDVFVQTFTDGVGSRRAGFDDADVSVFEGRAIGLRLSNHFKALQALGAEPSTASRALADQRLDVEPILSLTKMVESAVSIHRPDIIYTHNMSDLNQDHRQVAQAVLIATRPASTGVQAVYAFETPSSTEWAFGGQPFVPNMFVDVSMTLQTKLAAIKCYEEEVRPHPHPRSIDMVIALAAYRGAMSGCAYAEAFSVLRSVIRKDDTRWLTR